MPPKTFTRRGIVGVQIAIFLTEAEMRLLRIAAKRERRSTSGHASWIISEYLRDEPEPTREDEGPHLRWAPRGRP